MRQYHAPDAWLILTTLFLVIFGLIMVSSASVVESFQVTGNNSYYFIRQAIFALVGVVLWFFLQRWDYHRFKPLATIGLIVSIVLLIAVFIPGIGLDAGGSRRWIGAGELTLQVTEVLKIGLIIYLAYWFEKKGTKINNWYTTFLPFVFLLLGILALIIAEPDMGTAVVIAGIAGGMYFVAGAEPKHLALLVIGGLVAVWGVIKMAPYRTVRWLTFLNPASDPLGAGYHINQALIALGSGGLFGLGFGHSRQKFNFLPEASSDSIFAIIGEELGLLGLIFFVIIPLAIFIWRGFRISQNARDVFGRMLAIGITIWIGWQTTINIGAITGFLPLTGAPLPFISQGGTALVFAMIGSGILLNISRQTIKDGKDENPFSWWRNFWSRVTDSISRAQGLRTKSRK